MRLSETLFSKLPRGNERAPADHASPATWWDVLCILAFVVMAVALVLDLVARADDPYRVRTQGVRQGLMR